MSRSRAKRHTPKFPKPRREHAPVAAAQPPVTLDAVTLSFEIVGDCGSERD